MYYNRNDGKYIYFKSDSDGSQWELIRTIMVPNIIVDRIIIKIIGFISIGRI